MSKDAMNIALLGEAPGLAAVLAEYAASANPPLAITGADDAALVIHAISSKADLAVQAKLLKKNEAKKTALLILAEGVPEPEEELEGVAGIFRFPVRLAALLDAGFSALRLAALKSPRALSATIRFDPFTRALEDTKTGASETLTPKEADLLLALLEAGDEGLSRETALTQLWGYHREVDSHAVETAAWRLRRKLETLFGSSVSLESRDAVFYLKV
jgi:hypothetical protein